MDEKKARESCIGPARLLAELQHLEPLRNLNTGFRSKAHTLSTDTEDLI